MNPEFNGMKMNRVSICSRLPLQAVLGPLRRYVASGFRLNVQFFANGGMTPKQIPDSIGVTCHSQTIRASDLG